MDISDGYDDAPRCPRCGTLLVILGADTADCMCPKEGCGFGIDTSERRVNGATEANVRNGS